MNLLRRTDILSDSKVRPVDLVQGPNFIRGFKGNEYQRLLRRMKFEGLYYR